VIFLNEQERKNGLHCAARFSLQKIPQFLQNGGIDVFLLLISLF
jgi:hypothetical protein